MNISGMVGSHYFAGSPIVVTLGAFGFPSEATFKQVVLEVTTTFNGVERMYPYTSEVGSETSLSFDISSSLRAAMKTYDFSAELTAANAAISGTEGTATRAKAEFTLRAYTKYMLDGELYQSTAMTNNSSYANLGEWDELERYLNKTQTLGGSPVPATRKPTADVERVGADSVLSVVVASNGITQTFSNASAKATDVFTLNQGGQTHTVLRDSSQQYTDFLFVNQRGAVESVSAVQRESLSYPIKVTEQTLVSDPGFVPARSTTAYADGTRATWNMSSGWQTREWLAWWATDFLRAKRWWMRVKVGSEEQFLPVIVTPDKESVTIYDRAKQEARSVNFTVKLALEGMV